MAEKDVVSFDIIQSYGGRKVAEVLVEGVTAADYFDLSDYISTDITTCVVQNINDGELVDALVCNDDHKVTVGSGPTAEDIIATVTFKSY